MADPANIATDIFNSIRNEADAAYQARIPEATRTNIQQVGMALQQFTPQYNQFATALIERIGRVVIHASAFENPLQQYKKGQMPMGQTVQEIYIEPVKSEGAYNPQGPNPLGRRDLPNISAQYMTLDRQDQYCISLDRTEFMRNFTSWERVDEFIGKLMNSVYVGAAWDEYLCMRQLMTNAISSVDEGKKLAKAHIGAYQPRDPETGKALVQSLKYLVNDLRFPRSDYNQAGVLGTTRREDLVLFINKDVEPNLDVYTLTGLFNMEKAMMPTRVHPIDTFGVSNVLGILASRDWLQCYDVLNTMEPQRNAQGIFTNFFYNVWQILAVSPYMNAIVIYGDEENG